jgi:integration host factor subunit beta
VGRNPRNGEQVVVPEKLVPHFKPGKALRESVDAGKAAGKADALVTAPSAKKGVSGAR